MLRSEREHEQIIPNNNNYSDRKKELHKSNWVLVVGKWISTIIVDPRQILAGFLTVTMFVMLAHMIRREHFTSHSSQVKLSTPLNDPFEESKFSDPIDETVDTKGLWGEDASELKPCWSKPSLKKSDQTDGYLTFSLTDGPEYHVSQVAAAVVVARSIGATLVLPDIRGSKLGDKRDFEDVYDANKFIKSLDGVVKVVKEPSTKISAKNLAVVKVPARVTKTYIAENIEPQFQKKGNIRLATYFPSVDMGKTNNDKSEIDSIACLAMFGSLELQSEVRSVVDSMVERLRTLSKKSDGRFIAVDLRVDALEEKACQEPIRSVGKSCFDASEVAVFLRKNGYGKDTTIYLTQPRWNSSLSALKELFPRSYTKEGIMPTDKKEKFLDLEAPTLEDVIDFYIASESDVFVPAISDLFYANVAGKRISTGKTQILVPTDISGASASPEQFISPYVTKKNHLAYSCFC